MARNFDYPQAEEIRDVFERRGVRYLFILKNGPFDLDLVFAPDGIEHFEDAWRRRVLVEEFPVCHPDDIIATTKDRESLSRLKAFRDYWKSRH